MSQNTFSRDYLAAAHQRELEREAERERLAAAASEGQPARPSLSHWLFRGIIQPLTSTLRQRAALDHSKRPAAEPVHQ
jgi:hypothetical protein